MSRKLVRTMWFVAALAGPAAYGIGISGVAAAAPEPPSPASSAPASGEQAPAPSSFLRPLDASKGLLGIQRGMIPAASTPDMSQLPLARSLPVIGVTPLPTQPADDATADTAPGGDAPAADSSGGDSPGAATAARQ
ncbi:MAG TPA: hypothetical protein VGE11_17105 [Pseudonocardia sp.]